DACHGFLQSVDWRRLYGRLANPAPDSADEIRQHVRRARAATSIINCDQRPPQTRELTANELAFESQARPGVLIRRLSAPVRPMTDAQRNRLAAVSRRPPTVQEVNEHDKSQTSPRRTEEPCSACWTWTPGITANWGAVLGSDI